LVDFSNIKLLAFDFDGVMTDNKVMVDENGKESVVCNRSDGMGIEMVKNKDIEVIVISKEQNKVVKARCDKLKIPCAHGVDDKISILKKEIEKRNLSPDEVCFVGNDVNDIECIKYVGLGVAVNNAYPEVKKVADLVTEKNGGDGAVREIIDKMLS
jgi:YrbI family 3-deoxy-D-manno-octulosonate 8-phosphate phosphatase